MALNKLLLLFITLICTACGGGGGSSSPVEASITEPLPDSVTIETKFQGNNLIQVVTTTPSPSGLTSQQVKDDTTVTISSIAINIVHIDSTATGSEDGSFEHPFSSIDSCYMYASALACVQAEHIYIHANEQNSINGIAQTYVGNIVLSTDQQLIGDGVTRGTFAAVSSGTSPVLLGKISQASPVVTMASFSTAAGIQVGWEFSEKIGLNNQYIALPANTSMPAVAIALENASSVTLHDISITGYAGVAGGSYGESSSFTTGIHAKSTSANSDNQLNLTDIVIAGVLGDALYMETDAPSNITVPSNTSMSRVGFWRNGRAIHLSATGSSTSVARQSFVLSSSIIDDTEIVNFIEFNLNEGVLVENLLAKADTGFKASQGFIVRNTQIKNNQGAGIQLHLSDPSTLGAGATIETVNILQNEGGGIIINSHHDTGEEIKIRNANIVGNIEKSFTARFGRRQDDKPIDCSGSACNTDGANAIRVNNRRSGYGLYANNSDSSATPGKQTISLSGDILFSLHDENASQIYINTANLAHVNSSTSISMSTNAGDSQSIQTNAGETVFTSTSFTTAVKLGAISPGIAFCDYVDVATQTDNSSPHILFSGELSSISRNEECP